MIRSPRVQDAFAKCTSSIGYGRLGSCAPRACEPRMSAALDQVRITYERSAASGTESRESNEQRRTAAQRISIKDTKHGADCQLHRTVMRHVPSSAVWSPLLAGTQAAAAPRKVVRRMHRRLAACLPAVSGRGVEPVPRDPEGTVYSPWLRNPPVSSRSGRGALNTATAQGGSISPVREVLG